MGIDAKTQPVLSDEEWQLVIELLEEECRQLAPEIRHTRTSSYRHELRHRFDLVDGLLRRLRGQTCAAE